MRRFERRGRSVLRRLAALALPALLAMGALTAHAAPLTLALADLPAFSPALVAEAQGYFAAEGLDLKLLHCVNGRRCLQHLIDGEAQLATVADTPIVMAAHAGAAFDIVATFTRSREHRLIARADRGVRSAADLKGRRIGFVRGTSAHYFTDTFLILNDIDPTEVTLVPLDAADAVDRLVRGDVDAAGLYQPHAQQAALRLGRAAVEPASGRFYTATMNLVSGGPPVADAELLKLLRALARACDFISADPARARALVAGRLKLEPALLEAIWPDYDFRLSLDQSLLTTLESESRWAVREGLVSQRAMPDYLERIRPAPLRTLNRRAVTLVK